jgi:hypothetical protein
VATTKSRFFMGSDEEKNTQRERTSIAGGGTSGGGDRGGACGLFEKIASPHGRIKAALFLLDFRLVFL